MSFYQTTFKSYPFKVFNPLSLKTFNEQSFNYIEGFALASV